MTTSNEHNTAHAVPAVIECPISIGGSGSELASVTPDGDATIHWTAVEQAAKEGNHFLSAMAKLMIAARDVGRAPAPAVPQGEPTEEMLTDGLRECEPIGELIDWREGFGRSEMRAVWVAMLAATPASAPAQYKDSTPQLSVGESSFESWFESYNPANKGDKQRARDAYAAGMGDPLVAPAPAQEFNKSVADAEIKAMYVESQGSDKGWLGIEGSYFIGGVVAARKQKAAPAPAQGEPFGYFRAEPFGWTDCAEDDEGAIALYERPQEVGLTDEEIDKIADEHEDQCGRIRVEEVFPFARAIIAALRAKGGKHV